MKCTFLIRTTNEKGETVLTDISAKEWNDLLTENRNLPKEKRRYFMLDCIEEDSELDCMFIEVTMDKHHEWNSDHTVSERNRKDGQLYDHFSLDNLIDGTENLTLGDALVGVSNMDDVVASEIRMAELRKVLRLWQPWAIDFYYSYLAGKKRQSPEIIASKYGVSKRTARNYRKKFEEFVKKFLI